MFHIGEKVFYPNQGVGIIDEIQEREFKGEMQTFYNIHLVNNSLKLMMPYNRLDDSNIRPITDSIDIDSILQDVKSVANSSDNSKDNGKERLAKNMQKVKSGSLKENIEVYIDLSNIRKIHTLNSSENQMLNNTRKVIVDEISIAKNISKNEALELLDSFV